MEKFKKIQKSQKGRRICYAAPYRKHSWISFLSFLSIFIFYINIIFISCFSLCAYVYIFQKCSHRTHAHLTLLFTVYKS